MKNYEIISYKGKHTDVILTLVTKECKELLSEEDRKACELQERDLAASRDYKIFCVQRCSDKVYFTIGDYFDGKHISINKHNRKIKKFSTDTSLGSDTIYLVSDLKFYTPIEFAYHDVPRRRYKAFLKNKANTDVKKMTFSEFMEEFMPSVCFGDTVGSDVQVEYDYEVLSRKNNLEILSLKSLRSKQHFHVGDTVSLTHDNPKNRFVSCSYFTIEGFKTRDGQAIAELTNIDGTFDKDYLLCSTLNLVRSEVDYGYEIMYYLCNGKTVKEVPAGFAISQIHTVFCRHTGLTFAIGDTICYPNEENRTFVISGFVVKGSEMVAIGNNPTGFAFHNTSLVSGVKVIAKKNKADEHTLQKVVDADAEELMNKIRALYKAKITLILKERDEN